MTGGAPTRYPGLGVRGCLYAAAALVVAASAWTLPTHATDLAPLELAGLVLAGAAGYLFPVGLGPVGQWRSRKVFPTPVLLVLTLTSSPQATTLAWIVIAVVSGLWIRRHRYSPGRMAVGASMVTVAAWAGAWTIHLLDGSPLLLRAVAGVLVYRGVALTVRALTMSTALGVPARTYLADLDLDDVLHEVAGISLGLGAVVLREHSALALLVLAVPYLTTIAAGLQHLMLRRLRGQHEAMTTLRRRLRSATSVTEVEALMIEATTAVLDTPSARIGPYEPERHELGVPWQGGWLVAEDRRRAPTFNRPYRPAEKADLDAIVDAGSAAADHLVLLERLERLSFEDELTGLPNRRAAEQALETALARARRQRVNVTVVLLSPDDFAWVDDLHGHAVGDRALAEVARRLRTAARPGQLVARWSREEFLIVASCEPADAPAVAERLRRAGSGPIEVHELTVDVTLSCGVAASRSRDDLRPGTLVARADLALYEAKTDRPGHTVRFGDPSPTR